MRPAILLSSVFALSVLAGCTASTSADEAAAEVGEDALVARPQIELKASSDKGSVQTKLFNLMAAFKGDADLEISSGIDSPAFFMKGAKEKGLPTRSVACSSSTLVHATVGVGVSNTVFHECTLEGFDKTRAGGMLANVTLKDGEMPLADKLFSLLLKGEQKGGLGVKRTSSSAPPPCCDMPTTSTLEISDASASLSCSLHASGFAAIRSAECTYAIKASDEVLVQKGTLVHTVGIGGENTGFSVQKDGGGREELVLSAADKKIFVEGRVARVTGTATTLSGVETHDRPAITVQNLLVCPAAHAPLNLQPPVSDDTLWIAHNCPDLGVILQ